MTTKHSTLTHMCSTLLEVESLVMNSRAQLMLKEGELFLRRLHEAHAKLSALVEFVHTDLETEIQEQTDARPPS